MSLSIALLNIFFPLVIFLYNWRVNRNAIFLSLLLFLIATSNVRHTLVMHSRDPFWLAVITTNFTPLWTLIGPCLYFYMKSVLYDRMEWKWKDLLHTIPFWITLIGIFPYLFTPFEYKLQVASLMIQRLEDYKEIQVNWLMPQPVNLTIRSILQMAYAVVCMVMLMRYKHQYAHQSDRLRQQSDFVYKWLWGLSLFVFVFAFYYFLIVILYFSHPDLGRRMIFEYRLVYLFGGLLALLPFVLLFFPNILYGIPKYRGQANVPAKSESPVIAGVASTGNEYGKIVALPVDAAGRNTLEEDPFRELGERILRYMETEQPYLNEHFTLEDLARDLDVPKNHVHYCLRNILNTRFVNLRIAYRVAHAKKMLLEADLRNTTLEQIGLSCGFSSRSAFYKMFKTEVGCSPGEFLEKNRQISERLAM